MHARVVLYEFHANTFEPPLHFAFSVSSNVSPTRPTSRWGHRILRIHLGSLYGGASSRIVVNIGQTPQAFTFDFGRP